MRLDKSNLLSLFEQPETKAVISHLGYRKCDVIRKDETALELASDLANIEMGYIDELPAFNDEGCRKFYDNNKNVIIQYVDKYFSYGVDFSDGNNYKTLAVRGYIDDLISSEAENYMYLVES